MNYKPEMQINDIMFQPNVVITEKAKTPRPNKFDESNLPHPRAILPTHDRVA